MSKIVTSDSIRKNIQNNYPNPIALVYRRYLYSHSDDLNGRLKSLLNLSEVFIKFLCVVQLQEGRKYVPGFRERLPDGRKTLEFLRYPSFGSWAGLLRQLTEIDLTNSGAVWMPKIANWYGQGRTDENKRALEYLTEYKGEATTIKSRKPISAICNLLPNLRNLDAHGARRTDEYLKNKLQFFEAGLTGLLNTAEFLEEMLVFYVDRVEKENNDDWRIVAKKLRGASEPAPGEYIHRKDLELQEIYLTGETEERLEGNVISLTPFLRWHVNEDLKRFEMYFYEKALRTKLEYQSYASGDVFLHPELHRAFSDLIDLKLHPGLNDENYSVLSEDERIERAESFYNRALIFLQQDRLQNALEYLDQAVVYKPRADILLKMAEVMIELEEHPDSIKAVLQNCLEITPGNIEARRLLEQLSGVEEQEENSQTDDPDGAVNRETGADQTALEQPRPGDSKQKEKYAFTHLFCPPSLIGLAIPGWLVATSVWYIISLLIELAYENTANTIATVLLLVCGLLVISMAGILRDWVERLRYPLRAQVEGVENQRFENWFNRQIDFMFGNFCLNKSKTIDITGSIKNESRFYTGAVIWTVTMAAAAMFFTQSYEAVPLLAIKRTIDYLVVFFFLYPAVRYTIAVTIFVYRFSKLPLKPMLTRISNDGVRSLGPFIAFNIWVATSIYFFLHVSFALSYTNPFKADLLFLCIGTSITAVWTIAFPFQLRRALQSSKSSVIYQYSDHMEKAFKTFLSNPDEVNEKWYRHVLAQQKLIENIPVWPLSLSETLLIVVGSNLLLILAVAAYVTNRLNLWPMVSHYLTWFG